MLNTHLKTTTRNLTHSGPFLESCLTLKLIFMLICSSCSMVCKTPGRWISSVIRLSGGTYRRWFVVEVQPELMSHVWPWPGICEISCRGFDQFEGSAYVRLSFGQSRDSFKYRTNVGTIRILQFHLSPVTSHGSSYLHHLYYLHLHLLLLFQSFILNLCLGSSANPFPSRSIPFLSDWFHGLSDHWFFYSAQRLDLSAWCVRLSRLNQWLTRNRTYPTSSVWLKAFLRVTLLQCKRNGTQWRGGRRGPKLECTVPRLQFCILTTG